MRSCVRSSLRGAKRRSNPRSNKRHYGLLRFARNDGGEGATSPVRIGALELAQQAVATLDGIVHRGLCGALAGEDLLELVLDHIANQHERAEPDALRIVGRLLQRDLLDRN